MLTAGFEPTTPGVKVGHPTTVLWRPHIFLGAKKLFQLKIQNSFHNPSFTSSSTVYGWDFLKNGSPRNLSFHIILVSYIDVEI